MKKKVISEAAPVQVYLGRTERARLDRLVSQLDVTKSEIIRRGLSALEREILHPDRHPSLAMIGIATDSAVDASDAARDHDRILADAEVASWNPTPVQKRAPAKRGTGRRGK